MLFFEAGIGMVHVSHEWLSWAFVIGALLHVATNWSAFLTYFVQKKAIAVPVVVLFVVLLGLSFLPQPGQREGPSPPRLALNSLVVTPLNVVAQVAKRSPDEVVQALKAAGFSKATGTEQSIRDIAGDERDQQSQAFSVIFSK